MSIAPRLGKLREALEEKELDAVLISSAESRRYLSGFTGSAGYLLVSQTEALLATDFRYVEQAEQQAPDFQVRHIKGKLDWFPDLTSELHVNKVGFEAQDITVHTHRALQKAATEGDGSGGLTLIETSDLVAQIRINKSGEEIALLQRAIEITDQAFEQVAPSVAPGVTEADIAWQLERAMREGGAEGLAFDIIVGAGRNGAMAHHHADDTVIQDGDAVVIDMGARYEGYNADLTRTIVAGEPDDTFMRIYGTVLEAQTTAQEMVEPGMTGAEVDAIARDIIAQAGHEEEFGHSLGHGVGLAVHELPTLGPNGSDIIEDGMMFTIEPGIYLPEWGGVRIEDIVIMENGRARVLSKASKMSLL